ncbi:MAG TPA: hypothetical protein DEO84_09365 [candidate division Zixibacteria bacterium]|jgi:hypothetical protein|nr:hypothetical protein [candidate division Zixibacteria bacterium]HBZ01512.1 hypothetical protein [candidate division Zixibacteria bacterium]
MKRNLLIAGALLLPIIIAGCVLTTGTKVFSIELSGWTNIPSQMQWRYIDVADESSDYDDNKDKIKSVDEVVLVGDIINTSAGDAHSTIYISDNLYSTASQVETAGNSTVVFESPTITAGDSLHINWSDALAHIQNLPELKNQLLGDGQFYVYSIQSNGSSVRYNLSMLITITAGS